MKSVWRFIIFWRYLLMAWLVVAAAIDYLYIGLPQFSNILASLCTVPPPPPSPSLRERYEKIEPLMAEERALEILGPPVEFTEYDHNASKRLVWREGEETVVVYFFWGETRQVFGKRIYTKKSSATH